MSSGKFMWGTQVKPPQHELGKKVGKRISVGMDEPFDAKEAVKKLKIFPPRKAKSAKKEQPKTQFSR